MLKGEGSGVREVMVYFKITDRQSRRMHIMGESLMKCTRASCSAVMRRSGMHGASLSSRSRPQHGLLIACPIFVCVCVFNPSCAKLVDPPNADPSSPPERDVSAAFGPENAACTRVFGRHLVQSSPLPGSGVSILSAARMWPTKRSLLN